MKNKEVVEFEEKDIIEIEKIVLDEDKDRALKYIKKIYEILKKREKSHCKTSYAWENKEIKFKK
ncbi:MAG: hypothetical protein NC816_02775 [Candidatus Omnitrophica bacterium]|nr:hypothetical protein [Candidatus Omnitrophota bacterium]MCM8810542.1 hypothetical protein [Candidatus Omnitrophota bacterium]MCM8832829.1 hypothetical protein [Candidatus Omnitrophota bacterium]